MYVRIYMHSCELWTEQKTGTFIYVKYVDINIIKLGSLITLKHNII
jgi:hypothetical protein